MKLFTSLMFNGVGIARKPVDVAFQHIVLTLKILHLLREPTRLLPFLFIHCKTVSAEDYVIPDCEGERRCSRSRSLAFSIGDGIPDRAHAR